MPLRHRAKEIRKRYELTWMNSQHVMANKISARQTESSREADECFEAWSQAKCFQFTCFSRERPQQLPEFFLCTHVVYILHHV